eukprot:4670440-Amphidinium_carterae.2
MAMKNYASIARTLKDLLPTSSWIAKLWPCSEKKQKYNSARKVSLRASRSMDWGSSYLRSFLQLLSRQWRLPLKILEPSHHRCGCGISGERTHVFYPISGVGSPSIGLSHTQSWWPVRCNKAKASLSQSARVPLLLLTSFKPVPGSREEGMLAWKLASVRQLEICKSGG